MNKEHTEKLFTTFPFFGYDDWKDDKKAAVQYTLMPFGFECGDGWFDIIWALCECIKNAYECAALTAKIHGEEPPKIEDFRVLQVKEKFAGLRFYTGGIPSKLFDTIHGMITMAEVMSNSICEQCGNKGKYRDLSWKRTLCVRCYEGRKK